MFYLNINVWRQTYIRLKNSNKCVLTLNVNMYISTHIFDSKIPGLQTHPQARHQVVSGVAPSRSCWFGLRFWSRRTAKHPGLTVILVPDSNTMKDRTPLWYKNQRKVGAGRPLAKHQVVSWVAPSKRCWFSRLRFWSRRTAKHPGLTAILVPDSNTMKDKTPLWHNNQRKMGARRPPTRHQVVSGVAPSKGCWFGLRLWSRQIAKHPGLTAILVPDSNTMEGRTPL